MERSRHCLTDCPERRVLLNQKPSEFMDISVSNFSGDIARTSAAIDAKHCRLRTSAHQNGLEEELTEIGGVALNDEKQESHVMLTGKGIREGMRKPHRDKNLMLGKVKRAAKYLGGRLHCQWSSQPEVELRVRRARQAFAVPGSF
eukprot:2031321-Pyramimonas_sp.AAC.1